MTEELYQLMLKKGLRYFWKLSELEPGTRIGDLTVMHPDWTSPPQAGMIGLNHRGKTLYMDGDTFVGRHGGYYFCRPEGEW